MPKKPRKQLRIFRSLFRSLIILILGFWSVLLAFRWLEVPTSSFILQQNLAAKKNPDKYSMARYRWVNYEDMSRYLLLAAIAAEDQKFTEHYGFDFTQINAAINNHNKGKKLRGASTITQQLAKNLFLNNSRSFVRKGLEAFIAASLELLWPKKRILEVYLNVAQFGPVTYGVHQAALENFAKLPKDLNRKESAQLISVLPSPSRSNIARPSAALKKRQRWIIRQIMALDNMRILQRL